MIFQAKLDYRAEDMLNFTKFHRRTHRNIMLVVRILLFLLILGDVPLLLMLAFNSGHVDFFNLFLALVLLALFVFYLFLDRIRARSSVKAWEKMNPGMILSFTEDGAEGQCAISQTTYLYAAFTELFHSRKNECFYLYVERQHAVVLPERCFTQGDPAAFGAFIAEKTGLEVKEIK